MSREEITELLAQYGDGRPGAFDRLVELVYAELRRVARRQLRRVQPGATLNTTGLVHEAYLKLVGQSRARYRDRQHFLAIAARAMRQVVVDHARSRSASKRGAGSLRVDVDEQTAAVAVHSERLLVVNDALERLSAEEPRLGRVVECRFFAGYSEAETADALAVSVRTVERDWLRAKAWLRGAMEQGEPRRAASATRP